jgi:hypothetical protein
MANDVKSKPALTENQIARASEITRRVEEIKTWTDRTQYCRA